MRFLKKALLPCLLLIAIQSEAQTITDIDGNIYNTVTIGSQTWMQENLNTTRFRNGDIIATTTMPVNNDTSSIFQWPYNNDTNNIASYGRLYTWYAATDNREICPVGWHVPSKTEWETLVNYLGDDWTSGSKLKETGTTYWISTDSTVDNSSGFSARGGGARGNPSGFNNFGKTAFFWSSTQFGSGGFARGHTLLLHAQNSICTSSVAVGNSGGSIRCIKDQAIGVENKAVKNEVYIYPNPSNGKLSIELNTSSGTKLAIYNAQGKLIYTDSDINTSFVQLQLSEAPGLYHIIIQSGSTQIQKSFIIR